MPPTLAPKHIRNPKMTPTLPQLGRLVGGLKLFGNPTHLASRLGTGVKNLIALPAKGARNLFILIVTLNLALHRRWGWPSTRRLTPRPQAIGERFLPHFASVPYKP